MRNILVLKSSILGENSQSNALSDYFTKQLTANVTIRDLTKEPLPYFESNAIAATRAEPQTDEQRELLDLSNKLIDELKTTDLLVVNAPMYNFGVPAQLKSYFDYLARAGITFRYTSQGPEGLVKGKKAVVILTTGGLHKDRATDLVKCYVSTFLGFIGIVDVEFVYAEALGMGTDAVEKSINSAKLQLDRIIAEL
ncbi:FMN-dependent NADH-azoreductase [Nicoletella semolina]|uniref:FMN dependent NADH:quinone oxidoreductase n=1 Tax=Nicoletella semolina TaxID=271160 RepID=A0A4R2N7V4_9PAST|nr:NAD(P)H-dependent oxidoreductase [Nicoletella semolina]MDH2924603.1 FMN-dependent NADH-azoreductase [Nicoletella semolina]TCP16968.1 FMN-dependent NADH-azoreductase [Nicoletella semolina]